MSGEHYFSVSPASDERPRDIVVRLRGDPLTLTTGSGVFSPERLDAGTAVLLAAVPDPPALGDLLDLGCGWGPVAIALARAAPAARVWAIDVNERALALTAANAVRAGTVVTTSPPQDIPAGLTFATIWTNPPIRIGKSALHELLEHWLPRLAPGGSAWLVVARRLGADSLEEWLRERFGRDGFVVRRAGLDRGYRVLEVARPTAANGTSTKPE